MATKLINRKAVKNLILQFCEERQGWDCTRVSKKALDNIEASLRNKIEDAVHRHATVGKTFTDYY